MARALGSALVIVTVAMLVAAGLATMGWLVPVGWWPGLVVGGATASILTLALYFHPWLVLGLVIDAALVWAVVLAGWAPAATRT